MAEEFEKINEQAAGQESSGREGYASQEQQGNERSERPVGRQQRPRIHVTRSYSSNYTQERGGYQPRSYQPRRNDNEGGFRPEGFGAALQNDNQHEERTHSTGYRPRYNNGYQSRQGEYGSQRGGYQPRGGYGQQNSGYRPRYNQNHDGDEGGYQPRQSGYGQQRGGYQSRQGEYGSQRGGYQNRGYNNNNRGGYNNRYQQGGYGQRNEYGQSRGYRQRTADYDPNAKYSLKKRIEYKETHIDPTEPLRLNKFLANAGVCSRREADDYIESGAVKVNGEVVNQLGAKVLRTDVVTFHDQPVNIEKKVYVLLNKPKDCVTTSDDPQQRKTVMDLVKNACPERIYPVGRLDRNTTGVLLLTNDGDLASKLTHPKFLKKKVYHVFLDRPVTQADMQQIASGIVLDDGEIHADAIEYAHETDKSQVGIEIHSGKNRIVRRIFESMGYRVVKLDRVQFAGLTKKNLRRGDWRFLTEKEVDMLRMGAFE
ncbi:MAG: RNA-binding S4 domain-containing protein [Prevotella sp.]|nr:RNA-binding S4 domain-containing protein [Prevotella sp.]